MSKTVRSQVESALAAAGVKKGKGGNKKGGGGVRKLGRYNRHPSSCRYRAEERWLHNQLRRVRRHLKAQPRDLVARSFLAAYGTQEDRVRLAHLPKEG